MPITRARQDTQIRKSDSYDDTIAPTEAAYETNTISIEEDLNNLRSQIQNLMNRNGASFPTGDWFGDLTAPSNFENGTQRGIDTLNQKLHDIERKRVLSLTENLTDISVPAEVKATGVLTLTANVQAGDQVTTGTKTYTFTSPIGASDGDVLVGASASDSIDNLIAAITLGAGSGTTYAAATTANTFITASAGAGDTMDAEALAGGTQGNLIATTDPTDTGGVMSWGGATLSGGVGDVVILGTGELPANTTAAIGAVATLGTVAAYNADFGNTSLVEVAGLSAVNPQNLAIVVEADSHDEILSDGRVIYALFQTESNTDESTITDTTPSRAQLSFVRLTSEGNDLEACPSEDIAGFSVNYATRTRKALLDLNEQEFLPGAFVDIGSGSGQTRGTPVYSDCTSTTTSNNDIGGSGGGSNFNTQLPDLSCGDFLTNHDLYLNGIKQRPGADSGTTNDYYPGTSLALGQVKFKKTIKINDVIHVVPWLQC